MRSRARRLPLIHEYGGGRVYHIDLYRLDKVEQVATLGLDEIFDRDAVVLIEWGERFPGINADATNRDTPYGSGRDLSANLKLKLSCNQIFIKKSCHSASECANNRSWDPASITDTAPHFNQGKIF